MGNSERENVKQSGLIKCSLSISESARISCYTKHPLSASGPKVKLPNDKTQTLWSSTTVSPVCATNDSNYCLLFIFKALFLL